jgi:hypothetical protein
MKLVSQKTNPKNNMRILISIILPLIILGGIYGSEESSPEIALVDLDGEPTIALQLPSQKYPAESSISDLVKDFDVSKVIEAGKSPEQTLRAFFEALKTQNRQSISNLCSDEPAIKAHTDNLFGNGIIKDISPIGRVEAGNYVMIYSFRIFEGEKPTPGFDVLKRTDDLWKFTSDVGLSHPLLLLQSAGGLVSRVYKATDLLERSSMSSIGLKLGRQPQVAYAKEKFDIELLVRFGKDRNIPIEGYAGDDQSLKLIRDMRLAFAGNSEGQIKSFWELPQGERSPEDFLGWSSFPDSKTVLLGSIGHPMGTIYILESDGRSGILITSSNGTDSGVVFVPKLLDDEKFSEINQLFESTDLWKSFTDYCRGQN